MRVPNADSAVVDLRKLTDYCLSPSHSIGRHKASVFRAVLGLETGDAPLLQSALLDAVRTAEADAGVADEFGERFTTDFEMVTTTGRAVVRAAWIVRAGENFPRLTTCYIL